MFHTDFTRQAGVEKVTPALQFIDANVTARLSHDAVFDARLDSIALNRSEKTESRGLFASATRRTRLFN